MYDFFVLLTLTPVKYKENYVLNYFEDLTIQILKKGYLKAAQYL